MNKLFNKFVDWLEIDREKFRWWHLIYYPLLYIFGALVFGVVYMSLIYLLMCLAYSL